MQKGYNFESETDTEVIVKLTYHIHQQQPSSCFRETVEQVIQQLVSVIRPSRIFYYRNLYEYNVCRLL